MFCLMPAADYEEVTRCDREYRAVRAGRCHNADAS